MTCDCRTEDCHYKANQKVIKTINKHITNPSPDDNEASLKNILKELELNLVKK